MQFLADENFPIDSISLLVEHGFSVRKAGLLFTGQTDVFLLQEAVSQQEIILTFDKDFGELIFKSLIKGCMGIVLYRLQKFLSSTPGKILLNLLQKDSITLQGNFTVIDEDKIKQKPLL